MTSTELALLELKLLKAGRPYHVHVRTPEGSPNFICISPYCQALTDEEPAPGPGQDQDYANRHYNAGEL